MLWTEAACGVVGIVVFAAVAGGTKRRTTVLTAV
jgi:hypothetical protein